MRVQLVIYPNDRELAWVKECAIGTEGKVIKTKPSDSWLYRLAVAKHSPIRELQYRFLIEDAPYWVLMELCRHHIGCEKYVQSSRNDRQNDFDRNAARQDTPRTMRFSCNLEALMTIAAKRMCSKATPEMQELVTQMCEQVAAVHPWTAGLFRPNCGWQHGYCHEMKPCGRSAAYLEA